MTTTHGDKILIVGGYGQVGRTIAKQLAPQFPDRVVIAGRNLAKAEAAAADIGHGTSARATDITAPAATGTLDDVGLALVCLDQDDDTFISTCLARGIHYVDISAQYSFISQAEVLDDVAKENGATAILSVGVEPGLSNLLAAHVHAQLDRVDRLDIFIEIGLGDHHGTAAIEWMLDNIDVRYHVREDGQPRAVRSLGERLAFKSPAGNGTRSAYRFNFSDQHVLADTLGVPTVSSWMCFSSRAVTWLVATSSKLGLGRVLRWRWMRKVALWLLTRIHLGSDRCLVVVRATEQAATGPRHLSVSVSGRKEAEMTATVAADTVRQLLARNPAPGVFHIEQVIELEPVLGALQREVLEVRADLPRQRDQAPGRESVAAADGRS